MSGFQVSDTTRPNTGNLSSQVVWRNAKILPKFSLFQFVQIGKTNLAKKNKRKPFFDDTCLIRKVLPNLQKPLKYRTISYSDSQRDRRF